MDLYGSSNDDAVDDRTYPAVRQALADVHAKAPNARVAVLGYPWIVPSSFVASCYAKMPIARGDIPYLRALQGHLNAVIAKAASETGTTFVFATHDPAVMSRAQRLVRLRDGRISENAHALVA